MPDVPQATGALVMLAGVVVLGFAALSDLADAEPGTWYERRPVLVLVSVACLVVGGVLVAD